MILEEYDYSIVHIEGKLNNEADILSRSFKIKSHKSLNIHELPNLPKIEPGRKTDECEQTINNKERLKEVLKEIHTRLIHPGVTRFEIILKRYTKVTNIKKIINEITR